MRNGTKALVLVVLVIVAGAASYVVIRELPSGSVSPGPPFSTCSNVGPGATPSTLGGNWTTYHGDNSRSAAEAAGPISALDRAWPAPIQLDGQVYAEPLVCGDAVFVATENDSVYALNASTGATLWKVHLGTPIPGGSLPCGNIDPSGITGTPVIDPTSRTLYVVAFVEPTEHELIGLSLSDGDVLSRVVVDPSGSNAQVEQQRGALALANGFVYIPYGGLAGDCGAYHGWVVAVPTIGVGPLLSYQVPTGREGGIWSPGGITVAPSGDLLVSTGNSEATTTFDYGDSVIELSPTLDVLGYFAPTNWPQLNSGDVDIGSLAPTLLPNGDVFQAGKAGVGYLLSGPDLGGVGGQIAEGGVCGGAYGGTARVGDSILLPCRDGLVRVDVVGSNFTVAWRTANFDSGSPVVTGGVVWVVNLSAGVLLGFNLTSGQGMFAAALGSVDHFISPAVAPGRLYVAAGDLLYGFRWS